MANKNNQLEIKCIKNNNGICRKRINRLTIDPFLAIIVILD